MKMLVKFLAIALALLGSWFIFQNVIATSNAQEIGLSSKDYANGKKRFAAVSRKVTPSLKSALQEKKLKLGSPIFIRAFKEEKKLELWVKKGERFQLFRTYPIAAASGILGPKQREGDRQVPEGFYFVTRSQMNPQSAYHLAFNIGYPNTFDRAHKRTGSFIMIHGSDVSIGCLAMTDPAIEEIYTLADSALQNGQKFFRVHLFPFQMTPENLARHSKNSWLPFWENLQKGYQWFEEKKVPPNATAKGKVYHFE